MKHKYGLLLLVLLMCVSATFLTGCHLKDDGRDDGRLRIAYISKDLNHYWFQQVVSGIESKCMELDMEYMAFDAHFDDDTCMEQVAYVVENGFDGLLICATNQRLGPRIGSLCAAKDIPIVTIDDYMLSETGERYPHVGMPTREMGGIGGVALAKLAQARGFFTSGRPVKVIQLDKTDLSVFRERLDGYTEALAANARLTPDDVITIPVPDGMYEENMRAVDAYFSQHTLDKQACYIICGVNDDSALAPMHYLKAHGIPEEQIIACGLGGYELSVEEFENGNANYITTMTQPDVEGSKATEMLYEHLTTGEEMATSLVVGGRIATCDNYLLFFSDQNRMNTYA